MKKEKVKVGMAVKVSKESDVIYKVKEVAGYSVHLTYEVGDKTVSGGWIDICFLIPVK